MSDSQKLSYISLICKDPKNSHLMKKYRPISLLKAQDRVGWRAAVKKGCKSFEDHRRGKVAAARQRRKQ